MAFHEIPADNIASEPVVSKFSKKVRAGLEIRKTSQGFRLYNLGHLTGIGYRAFPTLGHEHYPTEVLARQAANQEWAAQGL